MENKHTKGEIKEEINEGRFCTNVRITDSKYGEICSFDFYKENEERITNAKRIVKCWNMHDELVEELDLNIKRLNELEALLRSENRNAILKYIELMKDSSKLLIKKATE